MSPAVLPGVLAIADVAVLALVLAAPVARAQQTPAHATAERANACAQDRVRCPTATAAAPVAAKPTATPSVAPRPIPVPPAAPTPVTAAPTPMALPSLPVPAADGGPQPVYLLPYAGAPDALVLASVFGRWAVWLGACEPLPLGTNLLIDPLPPDGVPELEQPGGGRCQVVAWTWLSNAPCAQDESGACAAALDSLSQMVAAQPEPTAPPPAPTPVPRATPASPPAPRAAPPAPVQQVAVVTRVVEVAATPTDAPALEPTHAPAAIVVTATSRPTPSPSPTASAPTSTPVPMLLRQGNPRPATGVGSPAAAPANPVSQSPPTPGGSNGSAVGLLVVLVAIGALAIVALTLARRRRRYAP